MVKKLDKEVRAKVVTLLTVYRSNLDILSHLEKEEICISLRSVERIRQLEKKKAEGWTPEPRKLPPHM